MTKTMKPFPTTYLGARAVIHEVRKAGSLGERVIITEWLDDAVGQPVEWPAGTVTAVHMTGDGRRLEGAKGAMKVFARFMAPTVDDALAWAQEALAS